MPPSRGLRKTATAAAPATISTGEVRDALGLLQSATRDALAEVRGLPGVRPVDLVSSLGIDLKLAWKISHVAQTGDPFSIVRHLPGAVGWNIWLAAARGKGASRAACDRALVAFERAIRLGEAWAGERRSFAALSVSVLKGSDRRFEVEHRRQLYEGGRSVWGVRAEVALRCDVLAPCGRGRMIDCATVRGFINLERLRPDATWRLEPPMVIDDSGSKRRVPRMERLDDTRGDEPPPWLLPEFCSVPRPGLRTIFRRKSERVLELEEGAVGLEGRVNILQGAILRSVHPAKVGKRDHGIFQLLKLRTPVEEVVFDLLVHEKLLGPDARPEPIVYSDLNGSPDVNVPYGPRDRIPCVTDVDDLGAGLRRSRLESFDRYGAALERVFSRCAWKPAEFRLFRLRLPYPPVPSTIGLELPFRQ